MACVDEGNLNALHEIVGAKATVVLRFGIYIN